MTTVKELTNAELTNKVNEVTQKYGYKCIRNTFHTWADFKSQWDRYPKEKKIEFRHSDYVKDCSVDAFLAYIDAICDMLYNDHPIEFPQEFLDYITSNEFVYAHRDTFLMRKGFGPEIGRDMYDTLSKYVTLPEGVRVYVTDSKCVTSATMKVIGVPKDKLVSAVEVELETYLHLRGLYD